MKVSIIIHKLILILSELLRKVKRMFMTDDNKSKDTYEDVAMDTDKDIAKDMNVKEKREYVFDKIGIFLRNAGFKKRANNFYKRNGDLCYCINIQNDKWNNSDLMRFTLNFGIFTDEFYLKHYDFKNTRTIPSFPKEVECAIRKRIGQLLPDPCDKWWAIYNDTNISKILADVENDITNYGFPFLEKYQSLSDNIPTSFF